MVKMDKKFKFIFKIRKKDFISQKKLQFKKKIHF